MEATAIERAEIDGIPVYWANAPGDFTAGFIFRVGRADETLKLFGIDHLIEHLALPVNSEPAFDFNGTVEPIVTRLHASGPHDRVLAFLSDTVRRLRSLPLDRLEIERSILRTEGNGCTQNHSNRAFFLRYGPNAHGLGGCPQYGLDWIDPKTVSDWAVKHYNRNNVVIWMTGEPPDDLELTLPDGEKIAIPEPAPIPYLEFPCELANGPEGVVTAAMLAPLPSVAFGIGLNVALDRARRVIRGERGLSYAIDNEWLQISASLIQSVIWADCLEPNAPEVRELLVNVLSELAENGPSAEEIAVHAERATRQMGRPEDLEGEIIWMAEQELLDEPRRTKQDALEEYRQLTPEKIQATLADALDSILVTVPYDATPRYGRFSSYPVSSPVAYKGRRYRPRFSLRKAYQALHVSNEGLSLIFGDGSRRSVTFATSPLAFRWVDGTRSLWSDDGFYVVVDPSEWRWGSRLIDRLDEHLDRDRLIAAEQDVEERLRRVRDAAYRGGAKESSMTGPAFETLARTIADDELIVSLVPVQIGFGMRGILALTDSRVLFISKKLVRFDIERTEIRTVKRTPHWFTVCRLRFHTSKMGRRDVCDLSWQASSEFLRALRESQPRSS